MSCSAPSAAGRQPAGGCGGAAAGDSGAESRMPVRHCPVRGGGPCARPVARRPPVCPRGYAPCCTLFLRACQTNPVIDRPWRAQCLCHMAAAVATPQRLPGPARAANLRQAARHGHPAPVLLMRDGRVQRAHRRCRSTGRGRRADRRARGRAAGRHRQTKDRHRYGWRARAATGEGWRCSCVTLRAPRHQGSLCVACLCCAWQTRIMEHVLSTL